MKAAVVSGPRCIEVHKVDVPAPGAGRVRIGVQGCGICGSDVPAFEGREWFGYPLEPGAPGHEVWGVVDEVGVGVASVCPGQKVAALCYRGYAEYDVAQATDVVTLPAAFAALDFPGEPLACACNVIARSGVSSGSRVAVVGVGFLGAVLVQLAAAAGAEVVAVSRRAASREVARACGAGEAVALDEATGGRVGNESFDVVIEATGKQAPLDVASALVRTRGRLVIAGFHQDGPRSVDMQSWNWRGIDVVNAHERDPAAYVRGLQTAVQAVTSGRISLDPLLTHRFRLDDVVAAFETASSRPDGVVKAVVIP